MTDNRDDALIAEARLRVDGLRWTGDFDGLESDPELVTALADRLVDLRAAVAAANQRTEQAEARVAAAYGVIGYLLSGARREGDYWVTDVGTSFGADEILAEVTVAEAAVLRGLVADQPATAQEGLAERTRRRMAEDGIPVGTDDPLLLALGATPLVADQPATQACTGCTTAADLGLGYGEGVNPEQIANVRPGCPIHDAAVADQPTGDDDA